MDRLQEDERSEWFEEERDFEEDRRQRSEHEVDDRQTEKVGQRQDEPRWDSAGENRDRLCDITDELLWLDQFILLLMCRTDYSGETETISQAFQVGNKICGAFIHDNETAVMKVRRKWHHQLLKTCGFSYMHCYRLVLTWDSVLSSQQISHNSLKVVVIWQISMGRFALFRKTNSSLPVLHIS